MRSQNFVRSIVAVAVIVAVPSLTSMTAADTAWPQWGGPHRNFTADTTGIASSWPASGPKRLWERSLGEGHSAIVSDGSRLFTMYRPAGWLNVIRRSQQEIVTAIDPVSGQTIWEYPYASPTSGMDLSEGAGPHSTPLIVGDRLFALSSRVELFAIDKRTGQLLWSHDMTKELGSPLDGRGHAPSPIAYRDTVIVPAGGPGSSVVAFNQQTGATVWKSGSFSLGPASPILINVDGQDQLIVSGGNEMVGMDPVNGAILWTHPHKTEWGLNISTPVWGPDNTLFVSAAYNNGSRLLKLTQSGGRTTVRQLWFQNRMRVHIGSVIRLGDMAVGSSGDFGGVTVAGIDLKTGKVLWQARDFARSTFLHADGKLIVLDEDGNLGLATASPSGLQVLAKAEVMTNRAWTAPTLVGTKLYLRDRSKMMALDLR
jgi:outer membrane protein assembly factor BamB